MILLALALASAPAEIAPKVDAAKAERPARVALDQRPIRGTPQASRLDALERTVDALEPEVPVAVDMPAGPTGL